VGAEVTVVIATFNRGRLLRRALASVSDQTRPDLEVVVVNDGGLDPSRVVAEFVGDLDVRLVTLPDNCGQALAANAGLSVARGRFVNFLDDDDTFLPRHLEVATDAAKAGGDHPVLVYGPGLRVIEAADGTPVGEPHIVYNDPWQPDRLWWENFILEPSVLASREPLVTERGFDPAIGPVGDWELWLRMAQRCEVVRVDEPTLIYHQPDRPTSMSTRWLPKFYAGQLAIYAKHPVPVGSRRAVERKAALERARVFAADSFAIDDTVVIVGNGNLNQLEGCLASVRAALSDAVHEVVVYEPRTPRMEAALAELDDEVVPCLVRGRPDEGRVRARAPRIASGRRVSVILDTERM
jgi:glycosyltransferase involved in cell wall biosynthesis